MEVREERGREEQDNVYIHTLTRLSHHSCHGYALHFDCSTHQLLCQHLHHVQSQSWSLAGLECQQCVELCKDNKCAKFYQQLTFCFTIQGFCFLLLNSFYSLSPFPRFFFAFFPSSQPFIHSCPSSQSFLSYLSPSPSPPKHSSQSSSLMSQTHQQSVYHQTPSIGHISLVAQR